MNRAANPFDVLPANLFNLFSTNHALKTSDHVSRNLSPAQASQEITHFMQFIVRQLEAIDPLLADIDNRHSRYLHTSLRHIRYQLAGFQPSVGLSATQAARLIQAQVQAPTVLCVENATTFHKLTRHPQAGTWLPGSDESVPNPPASMCLWGNPSPACRHLLLCLVKSLLENVPLLVWADLDYGGFNILGQLRQQISRRFQPYRMDMATLEAHVAWAKPLAGSDIPNLKHLLQRAELVDVYPVIEHVLKRGLKLEQEAIPLC